MLMSMRSLILTGLLAGISGGFLAPTARALADETAATKEPTTLRELIDSSLAWYDVFASAESEEPAKPVVVLRWAIAAREADRVARRGRQSQ
jgi:hypothetical protein